MQHALLNPRARGLVAARADASDATKVFNELKTAVEAMKEAHEKELSDIKKGMEDVVQTEKVDRINAEVVSLQKALDDVNAALAAVKVGGSGDQPNPAKAEYEKAFNKWFRKGDRAVPDADLQDLAVKAALTTTSDEDGGYVVPEQMEAGISEILRTVSVMRNLATVLSVSTPLYKKLVNMQGAGKGWVGETGARTETDTPTLAELKFPVFEEYANPAITQTALDDASLDLSAWLASEVNLEFAEQEGTAFISGTGALQPRGILSYDKVANASYAWGSTGYIATGAASAFPTTNPADVLKNLKHALRPGYRMNGTWLMNDNTALVIDKFKDGNGRYIWQESLTADKPSTLLGKPVQFDDNMPDIGAGEYPIAFADFRRAYLILDRMGTRVLRDPFTNKPYVHFYTTKRVGGGIQNYEAIKLLKVAAS